MGTSSQRSATPLETIGLPDRFEGRGLIASGGMVSVWCAYDLALGHKVAIKVLARQFAGDDLAIRRFEHEARRAARLSAHPHVVMIYEVAQAAGRSYIVMEYLEGGTVADAIRVGAVRREEALKWLAEAASALDFAHGRGAVHGDIKPVNLLLGVDRSVRVADFGITRLATEDSLIATGRLLGTAAYLSPERVVGAPASDASDRYALAVVAFELLVGQRPFTAEQFGALARQQIADEPPRASARNRRLPRAVDAVLALGMAKRPEDRWTTAAAFVEALDAALSQPGRARRFTAVAPPRRARRPVAIAALAAAGVAVGIVVGMPHRGTAPRTGASTTLARLSPPAPVRVHRSKPKPKPVPGAVAGAAPTTAPAALTTTTMSSPGASITITSTATLPARQPPTAAVLEARGHQLMLAGAYTAAVPVLRQAIAAASRGDANYAYALFDLGRSLRLAGDPRAAIPILERRLRIPSQTPVVLSELRLARRAGDRSGPASGAAIPSPPGHNVRRDRDRSYDGGAAITATRR